MSPDDFRRMDRTRQVFEEARRWVSERLDKKATDANGNGVTVRTVLRTGTPYREIVDLASTILIIVLILFRMGRL